MKTLKVMVMIIAVFAFALAMPSFAGSAATVPGTPELSLAWAQTMAEAPGDDGNDQAWSSHWRNEAGRFASQLILAQLEKKSTRPQTAETGGSTTPPTESGAIADPNARFRAAPTPEENLARVPAPKLTTENDYVPKLRPGEAAGVTVDYARIESLISRQPQEPTATTTVIPPLMGYGAPWSGGWNGGWSGWSGGAWGGRSGWWAGRRGYWAPPCALASPVYYDPYCYGGVSGGFFYRSRHFGIGVRF